MTNKTRIKILQRIEIALSQGFYLRPMRMAVLASGFTSDCYGGVCVKGALDGSGQNVVHDDTLAHSLDIAFNELQCLEGGFEGWFSFDESDEFYQLGTFIAREYANVGEND